MYEKAVNRRSNAIFNPKATLAKLKQGDPPAILDQAQRKALIDQYLDVSCLKSSYGMSNCHFHKSLTYPCVLYIVCSSSK